jgi:hypothetical protein
MKKFLPIVLFALLAGLAHGGVKEDIARTQKAAVSGNKLVAFVFLQEYWDPNCPTCVAQVNANNAALKKLAPTKYAKVLYLERKDLAKEDKDGTKGEAALPDCVKEKGPAVVVTDAALTTVIATAKPSLDKKEAREADKRLNEACAEYLKTGKTPAAAAN